MMTWICTRCGKDAREVGNGIRTFGDQRLCGLCDHAVTGNGAIVDCVECHQKRQCTYVPDVQERLIRTSTCFKCDHWLTMVRCKDDVTTVRVNGKHYMDGGSTELTSSRNGFGGSMFRVKFHDGRYLETNNMWHQGTIPDHFKERLPDNAVFVKPARAGDELMAEAETLDKVARFMRIRASAHQIYMFIEKKRLSNGVNWSGSRKSSMAQSYATGNTHGRYGTGPVLPESTIELLEEHFGSRAS